MPGPGEPKPWTPNDQYRFGGYCINCRYCGASMFSNAAFWHGCQYRYPESGWVEWEYSKVLSLESWLVENQKLGLSFPNGPYPQTPWQPEPEQS